MAKYRLWNWERNGSYDSYFFTAVWNSETNKIENIETGSTAGYGSYTDEILPPNKTVVYLAVAFQAREIFKQKIREQIRSHYYPSHAVDINNKDEVVFKIKHNSIKSKKKIESGTKAKVMGISLNAYSKNREYNVTVMIDNCLITVPMKKLRKIGRPNVDIEEIKSWAYDRIFNREWVKEALK